MVTLLNWEVLVDEKLEQKILLDLYDSIYRAFRSCKPIEINSLGIDYCIRGKVYGRKGFKNGNLATTSIVTRWLTVDADFSIVKTISGSTYEICLNEASEFQSRIFNDMNRVSARISAEKAFHEYFEIDDED